MMQLLDYDVESITTLESEKPGTSIRVFSERVLAQEKAELRHRVCHYIQEARRWMSLYDLAMSEVSGYEEEVCNLTERLAVMEKSCTRQ